MQAIPEKQRRIVILGPPASGKGTQGRELAASLGIGYLSTGALLRENVRVGSPLGKEAAPILARGEFLPDNLMFPILAEWLENQGSSNGWLLDGFPRSLPQALFLDQWLADHDHSLDAAIVLKVPFDELLERTRKRVECPSCRWSGQKDQLVDSGNCPRCGKPAGRRDDDDEENFRNRHREYIEITSPVVDYYTSSNRLVDVAATAPQEEVAQAILRDLGRLY